MNILKYGVLVGAVAISSAAHSEFSMRLEASRTECVSPCTVVFNVGDLHENSQDSANWIKSGYLWDYGDDSADDKYGTYQKGSSYFRNQEGHSRQYEIGPMGVHTYICEEDVCVYDVGLAVHIPTGEEQIDSTRIIVKSQALAYPLSKTICVSNISDFTDCPTGANHSTSLPTYNNWQDNTRYLIKAGESHDVSSSCMEFDTDNITLSSYGVGAKPELLGTFNVGSDSASCNDIVPEDSDIMDYSNLYWISNITFDGLRMQEIKMNVSFRNIGFHNLDMDFEDEDWGGGVKTSSTDFCTKSEVYSCNLVPLPYGVYFSNVVSVGSRLDPPGTNVGFWTTSGVSFIGLVDSSFHVAFEHNVRIEGASRVAALHNDFLGDHIGDHGKKTKITVRPEGYLNQDMLNKMRVDSRDPSEIYDTRYVYIADNYIGNPDSINNSSPISIAPTNIGHAEVARWGLVADNHFDLGDKEPDNSGHSTFDVSLAGYDLACYDNNDWEAPQKCKDRGQQSIPDGYYNNAIESMPPPSGPFSNASNYCPSTNNN